MQQALSVCRMILTHTARMQKGAALGYDEKLTDMGVKCLSQQATKSTFLIATLKKQQQKSPDCLKQTKFKTKTSH